MVNIRNDISVLSSADFDNSIVGGGVKAATSAAASAESHSCVQLSWFDSVYDQRGARSALVTRLEFALQSIGGRLPNMSRSWFSVGPLEHLLRDAFDWYNRLYSKGKL